MSAHVERSQVIDRPVATVFHFTVDEHVKNHPRWDPDIELWLPNDESIHVGTVIRRRNSRSGTPVEGTMEVVEYEPSAAFGVLIHDGPMEIRARTTFEALGDAQSRITMSVEIPGMDDSMDKSFLLSRMDRSLGTMKQLIESETQRPVVAMDGPIVFVSRNRVKPGMLDAFLAHYRATVPMTEANKPDTLVQLAYLSEDGTEVTVVRVFASADGLDRQLQGAEERSKATYAFIEPVSVELYGTPSDYVMEMMRKVAGSGIDVRVDPQFIGGFTRLGPG